MPVVSGQRGRRCLRAARECATAVCRLTLGLLVTVFLTGALARMAPGWNIDELALDTRTAESTLQQREAARFADMSTFEFCFEYTRRLLHGDLGWSVLFARPCSELLRDRAGVTLYVVSIGFAAGTIVALLVAGCLRLADSAAADSAGNFIIALLLSVPAPILGLLAAIARAPGEAAIFLIVFPRMLRYTQSLLAGHGGAPFVITAHAFGIRRLRILLLHVFPPALPALAAFAGALVPVTLSAAVPIEVAADIPGLGQLAWKATIGRDVPLLLAITTVVAAVSLAANSVAEMACERPT